MKKIWTGFINVLSFFFVGETGKFSYTAAFAAYGVYLIHITVVSWKLTGTLDAVWAEWTVWVIPFLLGLRPAQKVLNNSPIGSFVSRYLAKKDDNVSEPPTPVRPDPKQKMGNPQPAGIERISPNFTMKEFECHSGAKMPAAVRKKILILVKQLEVIRAAAGNKPITINSGYRSPAHNATVPGASKTSKHMVGMAADFTVAGMTPIQTGKLVEKLMDEGMILPGGIGTYPRTRSRGWVHYDFRGTKTTWRK